jgi:hypothetical protein
MPAGSLFWLFFASSTVKWMALKDWAICDKLIFLAVKFRIHHPVMAL